MTKDTALRIMEILHGNALERDFTNKRLEIYGMEICNEPIHLHDDKRGMLLEQIARLLQLTIKYHYIEDSKSFLISFSYKGHEYYGGIYK